MWPNSLLNNPIIEFFKSYSGERMAWQWQWSLDFSLSTKSKNSLTLSLAIILEGIITFFPMVSQGSIFVQWKKKKKHFWKFWYLQNGLDCKRCYCFLIKKEGSFQFLKRQNWFAILDFLERNMQMERKWAEFGKLHRKSIRNRKIDNIKQNLCTQNCRNETNKVWKGEEFLFLSPIFVERMETEDDNFFVEVQHQNDPWRSEEQRHTPKINWTQISQKQNQI